MHRMKFAVLTALLVSFAAFAGESEKKMEIKVVKAGHGEDVTFDWSGDAVDIEGLEIGEQRVIANGSGEPTTVTRTEDGLSFIIDGEVVEIPNVSEHGLHEVKMHTTDGITIITGEPLDDSVKETIRSVLITAGRDDEVQFINGTGHSKQVKVVRKHIVVDTDIEVGTD